MKLCNISLNTEKLLIDIVYLHDSPLNLTFVVSDLEMDCPYFIWENVELKKDESVWISPLHPSLITVALSSTKFSGFVCKVYHKSRLLQVEELVYNTKRAVDKKAYILNEFDVVGPSYLDFFHGDLCENIDTSGTVVDAGANVGFFTLYAASRGASRIYSIEPDTQPFFYLKKNFEKNPSVILINKAMTPNCDGTYFHHAESSVASSQKNSSPNSIMGFVESINIDTILSIEPEIHLLKLDIEGTEYDVLENMQVTHFDKIHQFFIEFHANPLPLVDILERHNFKVVIKRTNETNTAGFIYAHR